MAFLEFKNVRIAGISAGVPKHIVHTLEMPSPSQEYDSSAFIELTGVEKRRIDDNLTTADLCIPAAEKLIYDLAWTKSEIGAVIFVSQTPDYIEPATSCIIQDKLGLSKECYASDMSLGCSGWVYGLCTILGLLSENGIKKALLMCGDAKRISHEYDPLFGYAGCVTAVEYVEGEPSMKFHLGTDGSGYDAIIIPDGGARNPFSIESFNEEEIEGKKLNRLQTHMKGMDVFSFGISTAPKSIRKLSEHFGFDYQNTDFFIFHQANMKMNDIISKKLKLAPEKVPVSLHEFGNTSSASIPLTIVTQLKEQCKESHDFLCCGFGIGLSWGTVYFESKTMIISSLVEI